jgi:hypothetical protein
MGTRGFLGFVNNGVEKITYNHYDAYPGGIGTDLLAELPELVKDYDKLQKRVSELALVDENTAPTEEDREKYAVFADFSVSTGQDWYSLLRNNQGSFAKPLEAGVMTDGGWMTEDAGYAEWGYLANLDDGTFEVYCGYSPFRGKGGRWNGNKKALGLVAVFNLHDLPTEDEFLKACDQP